MSIPKGIHPGLGMDEYHAWKLDKAKLIDGPISCSTLKRFYPNPYKWLREPEPNQSEAMRIGSLFDLAVTDREGLKAVAVHDFDSFRTKEAREWKAANAHKLICTEAELAQAEKAAVRINEHKIAGPIFDAAQFQVGIIGEVGEIPAKCLLDVLPNEESEWAETLVDYKTTSKGLDDESIRKAIGDYCYHWQAAFYRALFNKVSEHRVCEDFALVFQDVSTLEIRVVKLSQDAIGLGSRMVGKALEEFAKCAHRGIRSRYANNCATLDLLPYHAMNEEEKLAEL